MSAHSVKIAIPKASQPIFIDTSIFIYLFEDHIRFSQSLEDLFDDLAKGKLEAVTSLITISEVLTKPYNNNQSELIEKYQNIFMHLPHLTIAPLSYESSLLAAQIRARYGFRLLDSFQLAIATIGGCKSFLTNDKQLLNFKDLTILYLENLTK